jgi:membrane-bound lytic murein transglycosylase D
MFMKKIVVALSVLFASIFSFAQAPVADTVKRAATVPTTLPTDVPLTLPKDSLHKELYLVAPAYEYIPGDDTPELISSRLSCVEKTIPLKNNKTVQAFIQYFTVRDREYTKAMLRKRDLYFPIFEKYLAKYNLPDELKYLSVIESGLNPRAISRARAVGLWQFMQYTGKHYGLTTDWYWDERMDPEKSTEAACKLLSDLYRMFKNWELALAAYNSGPGTVLRAKKRSGYKNDFWEIYQFLPRETRSYVPQFIAIVYAMEYAEEHNLFEPFTEQYPNVDTIHVKNYLNVETLANLSGTCIEEIHFLNPALKTKAIPANGKMHAIKMPMVAKQELALNRKFILDSARKAGKAEFQQVATSHSDFGKELLYYTVKSGDGLGVVAARYGVKQEDIKRWNNMTSGVIHPGQKLKVWVKPPPPVVVKSKTTITTKSPDMYVVQAGDSLWDISQKFEGLTIEKIKQLNSLTSNKIKPGQKLMLR